jgi:hypothetical protein
MTPEEKELRAKKAREKALAYYANKAKELNEETSLASFASSTISQ